MSFQFIAIIEPQFAPNSQTTLFTQNAGQAVRIDSLSVCNTDSVAATISINLVPSGGSAGASNLTTKLQSITAGQTWNSPNEIGKVLFMGDFISVICSTASVASISAGGIVQA